MKRLKLRCTLLTDVILNVRSATEGNQNTLRYIPGNCFLGIVAAKLYRPDNMQQSWTLFHSGGVRFGDAHPACDDTRSLQVPASMFYPKLQKLTDECYIHHGYTLTDDIRKKQLKQCRNGFYAFNGGEAREVKTATSFAIKSAYDYTLRRSKDENMYGYESLREGQSFLFCVEVDDDSLLPIIKDALVGDIRLGRSRTAQYGLAHVEECDYKEVESRDTAGGMTTVYADSRLIFIDGDGQPIFRPTAEQLGISGGEIVWEKSQVRTFQYAPWNFKRQCYDADRCGIERGSVFVVKGGQRTKAPIAAPVGVYLNEGFGHVIYNPWFLDYDSNGLATCRFVTEDERSAVTQTFAPEIKDHPLFRYLQDKHTEEENGRKIYEEINKFVDSNKQFFIGNESFASQWGQIRSIAMRFKTKDKIMDALFADKTGYLTHGVAKEKWDESGRRDKLKVFVETFTDKDIQFAIINLAAEMAKICRREKE